MSDETLTPERAVRLLRAMAGELEGLVRGDTGVVSPDPRSAIADFPAMSVHQRTTYLAADIAIIATIVADHLEQRGEVD